MKRGKFQMTPLFFDNRKSILAVGQKVAYNLSGEVSHGEIVEITSKKIGYHAYIGELYRPTIKIKNTFTGKISTVTKEKNLLVLKEENERV